MVDTSAKEARHALSTERTDSVDSLTEGTDCFCTAVAVVAGKNHSPGSRMFVLSPGPIVDAGELVTWQEATVQRRLQLELPGQWTLPCTDKVD